MRRLLIAVSAVALAAGPAADVSAGNATPVAGGYAPPPEDCHATPRSFASLRAVLATPVASDGTPAARPTPGLLPTGRPADAETVAGVTATIDEVYACFNAGNLYAAYALYGDAYLRRLFARQDPPARATYDFLAAATPASPDKRASIVSISGVRVLEDGRSGAIVIAVYPGLPPHKRFFFVLVRTGDRWLVDDIVGEISFEVP